MTNNGPTESLLTVREVARLLHVHPNTLRRWSDRGRIRAYRITPRGDRRFKHEEILHFLAELNLTRDGEGPETLGLPAGEGLAPP